MKHLFTTILLMYIVVLYGQQIEPDTAWIESEAKTLLDEAEALTSVVYYHLELDYLIENLDTLSEKDKIRREIYQEQKEDLLGRALQKYRQIISDFPTSTVYFQALNNEAMVAFDLNRFEDARRSYLAILNSSVNEKVTVLAQPFSNYQKNAAEMLYEIEFALGNYEQAKAYLDQSTIYEYHHFCGNAYEQKAFWQAVQYSKIESAREHYKEAASYIIPYLFERQLWREQELAQSFLDLLLRLRTRSDLLEAFDEAIKNFYTRRSDSGWLSYYIPFMGEEIPIDIYEPENKDEELSLVRKYVENQWMYYVIQAN